MSTRIKGTVTFVAQTEPRLLEAFPITTMVDVMDRQVEITVDFSDIPHPILNESKKFISRDPAVVAFMRRVHEGIRKRYAAAEVVLGPADLIEEEVA